MIDERPDLRIACGGCGLYRGAGDCGFKTLEQHHLRPPHPLPDEAHDDEGHPHCQSPGDDQAYAAPLLWPPAAGRHGVFDIDTQGDDAPVC